MAAVSVALALLSGVIGAGFASGREIVRFFAMHGRMAFAAAVCALFMLHVLFLRLPAQLARYGAGTLPQLCVLRFGRRFGALCGGLFLLLAAITGGAMLCACAELGALVLPVRHAYGLTLISTLLLAILLAAHGLDGLALPGAVLSLLLPALLVHLGLLPAGEACFLPAMTPELPVRAVCDGAALSAPYAAPSQTISYLSCHDDWTLWDRLVYSMDKEQSFRQLSPELLRANRLAAAINFCCQGHLFLLSGEEFARTKQGVKNSYQSPMEINRLDWERAWENRGLVEYYRGLIALRMQLPGLRDKSDRAGERLLEVSEPAEDCAALLMDNHGESSRWSRLLLAFSARQEETALQLPVGAWELLADGDSSFRWREPQSVTGTAVLAPMSALLLGQR